MSADKPHLAVVPETVDADTPLPWAALPPEATGSWGLTLSSMWLKSVNTGREGLAELVFAETLEDGTQRFCRVPCMLEQAQALTNTVVDLFGVPFEIRISRKT